MPISFRLNQETLIGCKKVFDASQESYIIHPQDRSLYRWAGTYSVPAEGLGKIARIFAAVLATILTLGISLFSSHIRANLQGRSLQQIYLKTGLTLTQTEDGLPQSKIDLLVSEVLRLEAPVECFINEERSEALESLLKNKLRNRREEEIVFDMQVSNDTVEKIEWKISYDFRLNRFNSTLVVKFTLANTGRFKIERVENDQGVDPLFLGNQSPSEGIAEEGSSEKTYSWTMGDRATYSFNFDQNYNIPPITLQINHPDRSARLRDLALPNLGS